jgi:hypothetical protein
MSAERFIRLAWQAEQDGRSGMRDALLTLAAIENGPEDAVSAERCRRHLVARRTDHWFASFSTCGQALGDSRVAAAIERLRATFPLVRVEMLLLRGNAQRGPYKGRQQPLSLVLDDLLGPQTAADSSDRSRDDRPALPFPGGLLGPACNSERDDDPKALFAFYLTVLLAIAILLASVLPPAVKDNKAA